MLSETYTNRFKKLSKSKLAKMIQSGRCFSKYLKNLGKYVSSGLAVPLAKDVLPKLAAKDIPTQTKTLRKERISQALPLLLPLLLSLSIQIFSHKFNK